MQSREPRTVYRDLDTLFEFGSLAGTSDGQLLERFTSVHGVGGQSAFEEVVRRHGPMVLGVCQRVLSDRQAAEDAFQATFLVLAMKARSIRKRESLGPWLHGVAARVARRARALERRRRETAMPAEAPDWTGPDAPELAELRSILDEELERLPEKYRRPVVLCYLEGQTQEEAARALGWTKGTVSGRLARAKELLRGRLTRRGLASTASLLGASLAPESATAAVPSSLLIPVVRAATAVGLAGMEAGLGSGQAAVLARGILRTMSLARLKMVLPLLILGLGAVAVAAPSLWNSRWVPRLPSRGGISHVNTLGQPPLHNVGAGFTADGKTAFSALSDGRVKLWDSLSGNVLRTFDLLGQDNGGTMLRDCAISSDGQRIAGVASVRDGSGRAVRGVWIWSLAENRLMRRIEVETLDLHCVTFSPEGASLATGDHSGKIQLWDVASGEELLTLKLGETEIRGMAFSPDGMTLAVASETSGLQLWDLGGGRALGAVDGGSQRYAISPCFSPDGRLLGFGTQGGEVIVWDRAGGRPLAKHRVELQGFLSIAFTPDSQSLAIRGDLDGTITVVDTATGRERWRAELGPGSGSGGLAYSPDGKILTAAHGGGLRFLDAVTGQFFHTH